MLGCVGEGPGEVSAWYEAPYHLAQQRIVPGHRKLPRNILSGYSNVGSGFSSKSKRLSCLRRFW